MNTWENLSQELASPMALILVGVVGVLAILLVVRRQGRASRRYRPLAEALAARPFERGFDLLLEARWQEAADILKAAVKADPNRTLEYLELANCIDVRGNQAGQHGCSSNSEPARDSIAACASRPTTN
jgi:uncharacterized protein HemY